MSAIEWIYLALATVAVVWAVAATIIAASYKGQVGNVQQAAGIAREHNGALRNVNESLVQVVKAYEGQLVERNRRIEVVESMNRMLIAAQPKPRARRAPVAKKG
jgi:hypothetical protein